MTVTLRDVSSESGATPANEAESQPQSASNGAFQRFELIDRINNVLMLSTKETLYPNIEDFVRELFESPNGFFGHIDARGDLVCSSVPDDLWVDKAASKASENQVSLKKGNWTGPWGDTVRDRKGTLHNASVAVVDGLKPFSRLMAVPIVFHNEVLGSLLAANRHTDYTDDDLQALDMISAYIAPVLSGILQEDHRLVAEAALSDSEDAITAILDTAVDAIIPVAADGTIRLANTATGRMFGYAAEELVGSELNQLLPQLKKEGRDRYFEPLERAGDSSVLYEWAETIGRRKDGSLFPVEMSVGVAKIRDEDLYIGVIRDTTQRQQAEEELRRSEKRYRTLVETMNEGLVYCDPKGILTYVNAKFATLLGYKDEELVDRPVLTFVDNSSKERMQRDIASGLDASTDSYEATFVGKDNKRIHALVSPQPLTTETGEFAGSFAVVTDITEHRKTEQAREKSEARYRLLVENMTEGLLHQDGDGKIIYVNPRLCDMLGYSERELVGMAVQDLVHDTYKKAFREKQASENNAMDSNYEMGFRRKDGETLIALIAFQMIAGADGKPEGALTVVTDITAHKEAEDARRKGEEKYRTLVEKMNEGFVQLDVSGIVRYINPRISEMLGHNEKEILGRAVADFVDKSDHQTLKALLAASKDGKTERGELSFRTKDGGNLIVLIGPQGIFDDKGSYQGTSAVITDITERKHLEQKLREDNVFSQLFQAITNATGDATTIEQAVQTCVEAICKFTGWQVGHAVLPSHDGSSVLLPSLIWYMTDMKRFDAFREASQEIRFGPGVGLPGQVLEAANAVWIPDVTVHDRFQRRKAAKDVGLKAGFAFPIMVEGEVAAVLEFFTEDVIERNQSLLDTMEHISIRMGRAIERKGAEVRLHESMTRFRNLTEGSIQGMLVHRDWHLLFVNQALADFLGYGDPNEVLSLKRLEQLFPQEEIDRVKELSKEREAGKAESARYEVRYRRKDGSKIWIENLVRPVEWDGQGAVQVTLVDIDERKKVEMALGKHAEELAQSNKELDDFAYIASHDLKAPLRGIHNYANFLLEDYGEKLDGEGVDKLQTLTRLSKRMEDIINDLLAYSRVGRTQLDIKETDLNKIIADVRDQIDVFLDEHKVDVRIPRPLPTANVDQARVRAVFHNLITNGAKYSDNEAKWVEVGYMPGQAAAGLIGRGEVAAETVYYVRDNGIGIRDKHVDKIFGMFKRLHAGDKYGGGTGAGLSIVKKIIDQHGGRIWVESEYGKGTTFFFTVEPTAP